VVDHRVEKNQKEKKEQRDSVRKALSKTVEEIFIRFASAWKTAQIYEPNNLTFMNQVNPLFTLVQNILKNEVEARFHFQGNTLFFNNIRIKFDFFNYHNFKFLAEEFRKKEIETICFQPGLDQDELKKFVVLLANADAKNENSFEDLTAKIKGEKIRHIFLERIHPLEIGAGLEPEDIKQSAKKIFFKSLTHLKEIFKREEKQERLQIKTTRRLIQSIVKLIAQDEAFMIGLTNIKNYDEYTVNHSINVSILTVCLGRRLGLDKKELVDLGICSFFHDIGKLEVPKEILEKKGKLSKEEREIIEKHTYHGAGKLIRLKELSSLPIRALHVALEHHLWANLSGYPKRWKKHSIDLFSKLVKICDVFDAVTTKRSYRKHDFTRNEALSMMLEGSGTEFDPFLLKVFANMIGVYPIGTLAALNTGQLAIVMETNPEVAFTPRPKVKIITDEAGKRIDGEIVDLTEMDPETKEYKRTIVKSLDPHKYEIRISDYFLAQGE